MAQGLGSENGEDCIGPNLGLRKNKQKLTSRKEKSFEEEVTLLGIQDQPAHMAHDDELVRIEGVERPERRRREWMHFSWTVNNFPEIQITLLRVGPESSRGLPTIL